MDFLKKIFGCCKNCKCNSQKDCDCSEKEDCCKEEKPSSEVNKVENAPLESNNSQI